jgi:hypothetical protein
MSACPRREARPLHFDHVPSSERDIDSDEEEFSLPEGLVEPSAPNTGMTIDTTGGQSIENELDSKTAPENDEESDASDEVPEDETDVPEKA